MLLGLGVQVTYFISFFVQYVFFQYNLMLVNFQPKISDSCLDLQATLLALYSEAQRAVKPSRIVEYERVHFLIRAELFREKLKN